MTRRSFYLRGVFVGGVIALSGSTIPAPAADADLIGEWTVQASFDGSQDVRKSISGAACAPVLPPVCVVALDEKKRTQFFTFKNQKIIPGKSMRLLPKKIDGEEMKEIDAEGAAFGDGHFYITGSHGLSRNSGKFKASSFFLFRFPVDPDTGMPEFEISRDETASELDRTNALRSLLKEAPDPIGKYAEQPLGEGDGGVNIEGLAYKSGRIFVGLRGPSVDGSAYIRSVNADALFSEKKPDVETIEVALGEGIGIRDLAAVSDGLLVLAGPVQKAGPYAIHHLGLPSGTFTKLTDLKMPETDQKAETILVLKEDAETANVLIMYDGAADGNPREYRLSR